MALKKPLNEDTLLRFNSLMKTMLRVVCNFMENPSRSRKVPTSFLASVLFAYTRRLAVLLFILKDANRIRVKGVSTLCL